MNAFAELETALDPKQPIFSEEGARRLVNMAPNEQSITRMEHLAAQSNAGLLSREERGEYESLVAAAKIMSILRLKAGALLANIKAA
jgi:hypothetical protein